MTYSTPTDYTPTEFDDVFTSAEYTEEESRLRLVGKWVLVKRFLLKAGGFATEIADLDNAKTEYLAGNISDVDLEYQIYKANHALSQHRYSLYENDDWDALVNLNLEN